MENNILVSIIVPIYNVEEYIRKCVDSVIRQTYKNIEIILVDDSSPDNCPLICDEYAMKDKRITVIHKKNGGLSDARNAGLEIAKGQYVAFVDADDYVDDNFIGMLLSAAIEQKADISVCNYSKVFHNKVVTRHKPINSVTFNNNIDAMRDIFASSSICEVMTWNKLYKRDLFVSNGILFPLGKIHEDNFTTYKLFYYANKITYINNALYYYVQRDGSIMNRKFNKASQNMTEASRQAIEWVEKYKLPIEDEVLAYDLSININLLNIMIDRHGADTTIWRDTTSYILKNQRRHLFNPLINRKQKILLLTIRFGISPYAIMRKIYLLNPKNR